jgi:hypothetical protein
VYMYPSGLHHIGFRSPSSRPPFNQLWLSCITDLLMDPAESFWKSIASLAGCIDYIQKFCSVLGGLEEI